MTKRLISWEEYRRLCIYCVHWTDTLTSYRYYYCDKHFKVVDLIPNKSIIDSLELEECTMEKCSFWNNLEVHEDKGV